MTWKPHVTVASIIEKDGKFLMVEEWVHGDKMFNQPAGHLEDGESLIEASRRETLEETGWHYEPNALISIQQWQNDRKDKTFLRFSFTGEALQHDANAPLDSDIIQPHWLSLADIKALKSQLRSPLIIDSFEDYLAGIRYPLSQLKCI